MGKFGEVAVKAADYVKEGCDPRSAWEEAICEIFERGSSLQKKGCPKNAVLGLYGGIGKNAEYAQVALAYQKFNPNKEVTEHQLWEIVMSSVQCSVYIVFIKKFNIE